MMSDFLIGTVMLIQTAQIVVIIFLIITQRDLKDTQKELKDTIKNFYKPINEFFVHMNVKNVEIDAITEKTKTLDYKIQQIEQDFKFCRLGHK